MGLAQLLSEYLFYEELADLRALAQKLEGEGEIWFFRLHEKSVTEKMCRRYNLPSQLKMEMALMHVG